MKTEFDFGRDYAEFLVNNTREDVGSINVNEMLGQSSDIPNDDYLAMKNDGIENPDARKYWMGYNSYFLAIIYS